MNTPQNFLNKPLPGCITVVIVVFVCLLLFFWLVPELAWGGFGVAIFTLGLIGMVFLDGLSSGLPLNDAIATKGDALRYMPLYAASLVLLSVCLLLAGYLVHKTLARTLPKFRVCCAVLTWIVGFVLWVILMLTIGWLQISTD